MSVRLTLLALNRIGLIMILLEPDYCEMLPRIAVCLLAIKNGKILAVARRGSTDQWGLVGGKVENGEIFVNALVREVFEETGLKLDKEKLKPVFSCVDGNFEVITYLYNGLIIDSPVQGDAGPVNWVTWDQLLSGPFGLYNAKLKENLGL